MRAPSTLSGWRAIQRDGTESSSWDLLGVASSASNGTLQNDSELPTTSRRRCIENVLRLDTGADALCAETVGSQERTSVPSSPVVHRVRQHGENAFSQILQGTFAQLASQTSVTQKSPAANAVL